MWRLLLPSVLVLTLASAVLAQPVATRGSLREGTTGTFPVHFFDETGAPVVPTTATYRVTTWANNDLIQESDITPLASSTNVRVALVIPTSELNPTNPNLPQQIPAIFAVHYTWGAGSKSSNSLVFSLVNVAGYPFPTPSP